MKRNVKLRKIFQNNHEFFFKETIHTEKKKLGTMNFDWKY